MARRPEADRSSETTEATNTKISDSGYSTACSNSQSQRSGSSKSIHSNSGSSNSSGYGGHRPPVLHELSSPSTKTKEITKKKKKTVVTVVTKAATQEEAATKCKGHCNENMETTVCNGMGEKEPEAQFDEPDLGGTDLIHKIVMAQALQAFSKLHKDDSIDDNENEKPVSTVKPEEIEKNNEEVRSLLMESSANGKEEFSVIVSMNDGKVLFSTPSLTDVLGFPKDMWLGRSIIDFIHKKDKVAFANHITSGVATPVTGHSNPTPKELKNTFFCCLRKYRGLKSGGFGVKDKETQYLPFQLSMSFKESDSANSNLFLVVHAMAIKTAYKSPDDTFRTPKFSTRQLSNCVMSEMDAEAVRYLGYLPQDIIGRSVFDFYHPEDAQIIKEMYDTVLEEQGSSSRCKPYRFRAQNSEWVLLETEWSSFVNPWSRKLEFIIGQHSVLKGPSNPDVFAVPQNIDSSFPDEVVNESKRVHEAIKFLLNECNSGNSDANKQNVTKRCKDLALFIKSIMDEISKPGSDKPEETIEHSFSTIISHEKDSVMLGEISTHQEGYSKTSSETPPSYSQLNYKENIARFFESKPKTTVESDENRDATKITNSAGSSEKDNSGLGSGAGSARGSGNSSGSNQETDSSGNNKKISNGPLTREILCRHNENMEKKMLQKHKMRSKDCKDVRLKKSSNKQDSNHGVKRCGSDSWGDKKDPKHRHMDFIAHGRKVAETESVAPGGSAGTRDRNYKIASLWPAAVATPSPRCGIAGMIPIYYIPSERMTSSLCEDNSMTASRDRANIQSDISSYQTTIKPVPLINAFAMFAAPPLPGLPETPHPPQSQATSKTEQKQDTRRMSECSKKAKSVDQEEDSPSISQDEDKSKDVSMRTRDTGTGDESSFSSSSSFNRTEGSWGESESDPAVLPWVGRPIKKNPPWMNDITVTPELILQYQLPSKDLNDVLEADSLALKGFTQPSLVDEQLEQLYADLQKAGLSSNLKIDLDPCSTSSDSCGEENIPRKEGRRKKRIYDYGQMDMIYEENMPLPPVPRISSPAS